MTLFPGGGGIWRYLSIPMSSHFISSCFTGASTFKLQTEHVEISTHDLTCDVFCSKNMHVHLQMGHFGGISTHYLTCYVFYRFQKGFNFIFKWVTLGYQLMI